ncbi:hypothetical protein JW933_09085 [candidate division FCPU426 bacterium]|nr:hypothetical protein [candidate division FCPU426 bacterium]
MPRTVSAGMDVIAQTMGLNHWAEVDAAAVRGAAQWSRTEARRVPLLLKFIWTHGDTYHIISVYVVVFSVFSQGGDLH